jgi:iron complex outermembrane receptor protein
MVITGDHMKRSMWMLITLTLFFVGISFDLRAEEPKNEEMTGEALLFLEIPVVVTASRKEQLTTEAPAAVTVVSAEDIRQSGALTIPDVLRMVSGVDVITFSVRDQQVGIRGMNNLLNNKVLVMIDGRSVYYDVNGNVFWHTIPIGLEEIERIEVIKSPISTLYGANAFSGVINIIRKSPKDLAGTHVNLTAGTRKTYISSLIHAGVRNKIQYQLSAGFDRTDEWGSSDRAGEIARGDFQLSYDIGPEQTVALSGGRTRADEMKVFTGESIGPATVTGDFDYLRLDYRYARLKVRAYRKAEDIDADILRSGFEVPWETSSTDLDTQYAFDAWKGQSFVLGGNYRHNTIKGNATVPGDHSQDLWALFIEDDLRITEKLRLVAGVRYDRHPLVKKHFSPRGTILYSPVDGQTARFSISRAYRNPTLVDSYVHVEQPLAPDLLFIQEGNPDLRSEGVTAYELGYQASVSGRATIGLNLFYNEYSDLIIFPVEVSPTQIVSMPVNGGDARGIGGELDLNVLVTDRLSLFTNYSYQQTTDRGDNPTTLTINEKDRVRHDTPEHKVNADLRMKFGNGLSANLLLHWVDGTERLIKDLSENEYLARVRSYTIVTGRVGYTFWKERAEASLSVTNIFNDKHFEYPSGINLPDRSSDPVGRKVACKLSCRF